MPASHWRVGPSPMHLLPIRIPRLASAVLYGHYAYSQGHPCRNSTLHVPQLFLHLGLLEEMKAHALDMAEAIQRNDFKSFGTLVGKTWMQKKALDSGTNPPAVEDIIRQIKDYTLGYKLPGAGGGGYLYMVAKDPQAALRIRETLTLNVPNPRASS